MLQVHDLLKTIANAAKAAGSGRAGQDNSDRAKRAGTQDGLEKPPS
jgi:hypothetical protein